MPDTARVTPADLLWVVRDFCTVQSYNILTSTGDEEDQFECVEPVELRGTGRGSRRTIVRGVSGPRPQLGSICLAGTSWLNSDVMNEVLGRFGAARYLSPQSSIDYVGLERVCAMYGMYACDERLRRCTVARRRLSSQALHILNSLRGHHDPADIDVFVLPVNAGGGHWYLLAVDVRGGDYVVRIHDPYGADTAATRGAQDGRPARGEAQGRDRGTQG